MLNDRNDKYDEHEESEYHFTDEDVSYEVEEPDAPKETVPEPAKETIFNRLGERRRLLISGAVFILLVFIVYRIVAPGATTPATDITPASVTQATAPAQPVTAQAPSNVAPSAPRTVQATMISQAPLQPTTPPAAMMVSPSAPTNGQQAQPVTQTAAPATTTTTTTVTTAEPPAATGMPPVIAVQSPTATYPTAGGQATNAVAPRVAAMGATSDQLVAQLQQDYSQKMNDFAAQSKALQDQLETLSARVATMENQMTQMIQTFNKQAAQQTQLQQQQAQAIADSQQASAPADNKTPYNVQAIIPGRAWLKADNGETITVAEGDVVRDLGRITKIDPYDGTVQINTGSKVITLSYGNGG